MKKKLYILFSIIISVFCISIVKIELQNDTFSAIKIGDYIINNGLDFTEHFNFNPDLSFHNARWLFNVIIAFIYNSFGFVGIYIFTCLLSIILGLLIFNIIYKMNKSLIISLVITILSMAYASGYITARAQLISYILFLLEIYFIEKLLRKNKIRYCIYILIISILIANIHTTVWPITLVLFMPYFAEYLLSKTKFIKKSKRLYSDITSIKLLFITFIITSISGLVSPLGLLPYTYMFKTMSGISVKFIQELERVNIFFDYRALVLFVIYIYLFVYLKNKIKISDLFMVTGLFFLGILAIRNLVFLIILCTICLCRQINNALEDNISKVKIIEDRIYSDKFILGVIIFYILFLGGINYSINIYNKKFINDTIYPVKASDYILKNLDTKKMRLYNDFDIGSYLEYRGIKVFLDSRSEVFCKEFNDTTILEDFYNINYFQDHYKKVFDKYSFTHILLNKDITLDLYVKNDNDYKLIYQDDYYVLYEKVE